MAANDQEWVARKDAALSRRAVTGMICGSGLATLLPGRAKAQAPTGTIDVHHHFRATFLTGGGPGQWGIERSLESMDMNGVAKAVLSPATGFAEDIPIAELPALARRVNEFGAEARRQYPTRFGQFAYLPLPDIDAALEELSYGFDVLNANGIIFPTNYGETYVTDPSFAPVWEELDRRAAVAYFHPRAGACCESVFPDFAAESTWLEIPYDTGRAIMHFMVSGTFRRYRNIKWIFSHSGGPMPSLAGRLRNLADGGEFPEGIDAELQRLHYETGNAASRATLAALLALVPESQVLFGSDHPYVSIATNLADMTGAGLPAATLAAIERENALRIIPGLAG